MGSIAITRDGPVLHIRMDRPAVRNAIDEGMAAAAAAAIDLLERTDELRVAVLDGAGGNFSSGMDLKAFLAGQRPNAGERGLLGVGRQPPAKPLLAAVEGYALGAGFEVALACDLVVAGRSAQFGLPEVSRGMIAGGGGLIQLAHRVPYVVAIDIAVMGRRLSAQEAADHGLVSQVVEQGQALEEALRLAHRMAALPSAAVLATRDILRAARWWPLTDAFRNQQPYLESVLRDNDAQVGAAAFLRGTQP